MTRHRDPDERCGSCGIRLTRVDAEHEERCTRKAAGLPPLQEEPMHPAWLAVFAERDAGQGPT